MSDELEAMRDAVAKVAVMLSIYEEEPDENGQVSFQGALASSAAVDLVALVFPLREKCRHRLDLQAGCCSKCGINVEDIPVGIVME